MLRVKYLIAVLTLCVSFGLSAALSTPSFATSLYTFTFTATPNANPGWDANGSFFHSCL